jgi:hypothetical protein
LCKILRQKITLISLISLITLVTLITPLDILKKNCKHHIILSTYNYLRQDRHRPSTLYESPREVINVAAPAAETESDNDLQEAESTEEM